MHSASSNMIPNVTSKINKWPHVECFSESRAYYSLLIVVSFFIISINLDVIYTMATNKSLRTERNAFLASLSVSDLLTGLVSIPLHIASNCYFPPSEILIIAQAICFRFVAISTMLNILMITVERYIGIIYPLKYKFILTKTRTFILITCTWATSISAALVAYSWLVSSKPGNAELPPKEIVFERAYFIFTFLSFFLLPLIIMIVLYTKMFRTISKARKLASNAHMFLKNTSRTHSLLVRGPIEVRVTRPRSVSHGSYGDHKHTRRQIESAASSPDTRSRSRSHGSDGDHRTTYGKSRSTAQFPTLVGTRATNCKSRDDVTISRPQSPTNTICDAERCRLVTAVSEHMSSTLAPNQSSRTDYLSLPMNEANRYIKHYGSYDRFKGRGSSSCQSLGSMRGSKTSSKYQSDDAIATQRTERMSFASRLSDACEMAASRLRMFRLGSNNEERWGQARIKREHRVLLLFVTMLSVFVFSWMSWYILILDFTYSIHIPELVLDCFDILRFSVSFVNPILYTFFKNDFRIAFKKSLRRWSGDQQKGKNDVREKFIK